MHKQVALIFGVGGLGTTISQNCCRLGYKKIYLIDMDVVDDHNLNRQLLFSKDMVNQSKVQSAIKTLESLHNLQTEIVPVEVTNATEEWARIVKIAKDDVTCIFNSIDFSDHFTAAIASMALELGIPLVDGGTEPVTGHMCGVMLQTSEPGKPCFGCQTDTLQEDVCSKFRDGKVMDLEVLDFLPSDLQIEDMGAEGGSCVYSCAMCAHLMSAIMNEHIMGASDDIPSRVFFYMLNFSMDSWTAEVKEGCPVCGGGKKE